MGSVRVMFWIYAALIALGLVLFTIVGIAHN